MFEITKKLNGGTIETKSIPNMSQVWNYARDWRDHLTSEQIGQKAEFIVHDSEAADDLKDLRITAKAGKNGKVLMMNSNPESRRSSKSKQALTETPTETPVKKKRKSNKIDKGTDADQDADKNSTLEELAESFGCNSDDSNLPEDATEFNPETLSA